MKTNTFVFLLLLSFLAGVMVGAITWKNIQSSKDTFVTQTFTITTYVIEQNNSLKYLIPYEVYFSPNGGCEKKLIYWFNKANFSIHIMIYSFTLDNISEALIAAHKRGIEVKVVFEKE